MSLYCDPWCVDARAIKQRYDGRVWRRGVTRVWRQVWRPLGSIHVWPRNLHEAPYIRPQMSTGPPNRDKGMTALWRNYDDCHTWGSLSFFCMSLHHEVDASGLPRPLVNRDSCKRETPCTWQGYDGKVWRQGMTTGYDDKVWRLYSSWGSVNAWNIMTHGHIYIYAETLINVYGYNIYQT